MKAPAQSGERRDAKLAVLDGQRRIVAVGRFVNGRAVGRQVLDLPEDAEFGLGGFEFGERPLTVLLPREANEQRPVAAPGLLSSD